MVDLCVSFAACRPLIGSWEPTPAASMIILCGAGRAPVRMDSTREYTFEEVANSCSSAMDRGDQLYFEYYPGLVFALRSPDHLELACTMVVGYHNAVLVVAPSDDGPWDDPRKTLGWLDLVVNHDSETEEATDCQAEDGAGDCCDEPSPDPEPVLPRSRYSFGRSPLRQENPSDLSDETGGGCRPFSSMPLWHPGRVG